MKRHQNEQVEALQTHLREAERMLSAKKAVVDPLSSEGGDEKAQHRQALAQIDDELLERIGDMARLADEIRQSQIQTEEEIRKRDQNEVRLSDEIMRLQSELAKAADNLSDNREATSSAVWPDDGEDPDKRSAHRLALSVRRRAVELNGRDEFELRALGDTLLKIGARDEAVTTLGRAFAINPCLPGLAARLQECGVSVPELIELAASTLPGKGARSSPTLWPRNILGRRRAIVAENTGRPKEAAQYYLDAASKSDNVEQLLALGDSIARNAGLNAASGAYVKALVLDPDNKAAQLRIEELKYGSFRFRAGIKADLKMTSNGSYLSLSEDPQFALDPDGRDYPSGWTLVSVRAESFTAALRPVLYVWFGKRSKRRLKIFTLPSIEGRAEVRCLLSLPDEIASIRLDPISFPHVSFRLQRVGWLCEGALVGRQFTPAAAGVAFVGEVPPETGALPLSPHYTALGFFATKDLQLLDEGWFRSTGTDPQFQLTATGVLPHGWTWLEIEVTGLDAPLNPVLYAWSEGEIVTIEMAMIDRPGALRRLVRLPDRVTELRFDPTANSGTAFQLKAIRTSQAQPGDRVYLPADKIAESVDGGWEDDGFSVELWPLEPVNDLKLVDENLFTTVGDAPEFAVDNSASTRGLVRLTIEVGDCSKPLDAVLIAYVGQGSSNVEYRFTGLAQHRHYEFHLYLPLDAHSLRFRPDGQAGVDFSPIRLLCQLVSPEDGARYTPASALWSSGAAPPEVIAASLQPIAEIERMVEGAFLSTGQDPQFSVSLGSRPMPSGWTLISLEMTVERTLAQPILYVWHGADVTPVVLQATSGGIKQQLIYLSAGVTGMRFDPVDFAGVKFSDLKLEFAPADLLAGQALMRHGANDKSLEYAVWCEEYDTLGKHDEELIGQSIERLAETPLISVLMPVYNPEPRFLRRALDTVVGQFYPHWELCIADDCSTNPDIKVILQEYSARDKRIKVLFRSENGHISRSSNSALDLATGSFIALMDHDDELAPHALYLVARELNLHPDADIIYSDEDKIDAFGRRHDPHFKTDWNQELFYSQNMVAHLGVYRTSLVRAVEGFRAGFEGSQDYDFTLRVLKLTQPDRIRHIPHILYHWRIFQGVSTFSSDNPSNSINTAQRALTEYFAEVEPSSQLLPIEAFPSWWRVRRALPKQPPSITIIIPTRDRIELVRGCVDGILNRTDYTNLDIIIVDNGSEQPESIAYFAEIANDERVRVIRDDGPFNYSRLNNEAAAQARGDYLCFLNNDIEVIESDWLTEMVSQVIQDGVGAVGTRLLYADGTLQHAGVNLGIYGVAAHGHRHFPGNSIGYFGHPQLVREVSAATAAALLMPKAIFHQIGGFDAANLAVSYNDVDLCLRIGEAGYRIIYTPFAALFHLESATRGPDVRPEQKELQRVERGYMRARWGSQLDQDKFYSPNLTLTNEDYTLAFPPRSPRPWLAEADVAERLARIGRSSLPDASTEALRILAADTAVIIASSDPYAVLSALAETWDDALIPTSVYLVDNIARRDAHIGRGVVEAIQAAWPDLALHVVEDPTQDFNASRTANIGVGLAKDSGHLVVITEDCTFTSRWFEMLLTSWLALADTAMVLSPQLFVRESSPRNGLYSDGFIEKPVTLVERSLDDVLPMEDGYGRLPVARHIAPDHVTLKQSNQPTTMIQAGLIMARRERLMALASGSAGDEVFDPVFLTQAARWEDLSRRLETVGVVIRQTIAPLAVLSKPRLRDLPQRWRHWHDYFAINRKYHGVSDRDVLEFVCPFHRGDVLIGLQIAYTAHRHGRKLRFHVAQSLVNWVKEFDPPFPIESLPVPVPAAEETALYLLRSYEHVVGRPDASPYVVGSHPTRGLDAMNNNLATAMLDAIGLPTDTLIDNLLPRQSEDQRRSAAELLSPFGDRVILLHRFGGWTLKSLPDAVLSEFADIVKSEGFKLIQIGGPDDVPFSSADGKITRNLTVGEWASLFQSASAVAGIDSWTSHMAALLDVPQITFYGSTHPDHVASKPYFHSQRSAALLIPPTVACSPCNSLTCLYQSEPFCLGYSVDRAKVVAFLRSL